MTDIYMAFNRLPAKQIFHTDGKEWVKCPFLMRWDEIVFNAFVNIEDDISAGLDIRLDVRLFNPEDIVHIESDAELFSYEIMSNGFNTNDN